MFAVTGVAAHIGDCAAQKGAELFYFCLREALNHLGFYFQNGAMDSLCKFPALGQKVNPFAPAVGFVGLKLDEILLFQPGQQTGNCGVAQVEFLLNIPGAGGTFPVGDIAQNGALRGSQVKMHQCLSHPLVGAPVEDSDIVAEVPFQKDHLQNKNVASYILY